MYQVEDVSKRQLLFIGRDFPLLIPIAIGKEGCPSGAKAGWYVLSFIPTCLSLKKDIVANFPSAYSF